MNRFLETHDYFTGTDKPGLSDFMMVSPLITVIPANLEKQKKGERPRYNIGPGLEKWWERVSQRDAFKRAMVRLKQEEGKANVSAKL